MPHPPEKESLSSLKSFLKKPKGRVILIIIIINLGICLLITFCTACIILTPTTEDDSTNEIPDQSEILGEQTQEAPKYKVLEITDGDTIKIDYNGTGEKVRLIGIDTPEKNKCFNTEATNKLKSLLGNNEVEIEADQTQGERDKYNRLLLYIWLKGELVNKTMISEGYAHEYTYNLPYKYQQEFKDAQREAQNTKRGLWGDACSCKKDSEKSRVCIGCKLAEVEYYNWDCSTYKEQISDNSCVQDCTVYTPPSTTTTTIAPSTPPLQQLCKYACNGPDRDCSDFTSQAEAQEFFDCCDFTKDYDPMRLDGIGVDDGIPCENLP